MAESANFERDLLAAVERVVLKKITDGAWLGVPYASTSGTPKISTEFLKGLFAKVDMGRVTSLVLAKVEERIADKLYNALATEVANDTKSLMCDTKTRDLFRDAIRARIAAVAADAKEKAA